MKDIIIMGILLIVIGSAIFYIVRQKRKGTKCIGCPASKDCKSKGGCN